MPTANVSCSATGVSPTSRTFKAQFVCGVPGVGSDRGGGSVLLVASAKLLA